MTLVPMSHGVGAIHRIGEPLSAVALPSRPPSPRPEIDFAAVVTRWSAATDKRTIGPLAKLLGVTRRALEHLGIVRAPQRPAWGFPMRNETGNIIGLRLRYDDGRKLSLAYSRSGLFMPDPLVTNGLLVICEGPTDAAAALGLTGAVVGRPSCSGGDAMIAELVRVRKPQRIVVIGDNDEPGRLGAEALAGKLHNVKVAYPPELHKDLRAWIGAGGARDFARLLEN